MYKSRALADPCRHLQTCASFTRACCVKPFATVALTGLWSIPLYPQMLAPKLRQVSKLLTSGPQDSKYLATATAGCQKQGAYLRVALCCLASLQRERRSTVSRLCDCWHTQPQLDMILWARHFLNFSWPSWSGHTHGALRQCQDICASD